MSNNTKNVLTTLGNASIPMAARGQQMIDIMAGVKNGDDNCEEIAHEIFSRLQSQAADELGQAKLEYLNAVLAQIESAPLRAATFVQMADLDGSKVEHALVIADNGELAYVVAHDQKACKKLRIGDRVMLDAHGKILVHPSLNCLYFGHEARYERKIDERHIEVLTHQDDKLVVMVGPELMEAIDNGTVERGAAIVLGAGERLGVRALPPVEKNHFRFLDTGGVPDILVDRDVASPPKVIEQVEKHVREEMTRPDKRRRFKLRPCITRLLAGVSGSGKTLAVQAIHRKLYEVMSEITGTPIGKLPNRVFRFKTSQMLSMWLGESDKNIDKLFDEVEQVACVKYTNEKGKEFVLPVMVVLEEADGMGRARGQEAIYDRILTTILQRLDPNRAGLSDKLVVFLSTTNEPQMIDPAFLRRIGGSVETFGRLDEKGFTEMLTKHVAGLPAEGGKKGWEKIIEGVSRWMFDPEQDAGVLALTYQGNPEPVIKHRRDFLTGALVDRAVQQAATKAWEKSISGDPDAGITMALISGAISDQVHGIAHQVMVQNAHSYLDIPEGVRVSSVKRITHSKK